MLLRQAGSNRISSSMTGFPRSTVTESCWSTDGTIGPCQPMTFESLGASGKPNGVIRSVRLKRDQLGWISRELEEFTFPSVATLRLPSSTSISASARTGGPELCQGSVAVSRMRCRNVPAGQATDTG